MSETCHIWCSCQCPCFIGFSFNFPHKKGLCVQIPLGVVLAIPPFNYPVNLAVSKIAPALISGNSIVLKPPTQVYNYS